ncbi:MAG: 2-hydroxy-3-oxopropionate reductase [Betaproteobacteria bacterium]|nr:2-hydroxy-3-oxopropionate reductase [Betaproteobacteria bacterium]
MIHPRIAFLGIGLMGLPMARNLLKAGFPVTVWNRTRSKAEVLVEEGATVAETPEDALRQADLVITMLESGAIVEEVLFGSGAVKALPKGALVIDMSSIKPREAQAHAEQLRALGCRHLDAPVSGGTLGAEAATLAIMAGGEEADFAEAEAVLKVLGKPLRVGPHGSGQLAKLANQMIVGITIGAVAEALQLAAAGGADPALVREAIRGGFAGSRILEVHGERMLKRDFAARATAQVQLKDMNNALDAAAGFDGHQLPITAQLRDLYASLCKHGGAGVDHSGLFLELERINEKAEKVRFP